MKTGFNILVLALALLFGCVESENKIDTNFNSEGDPSVLIVQEGDFANIDTKKLFEEGYLKYLDGNFQEALKYYYKAVKNDSTNNIILNAIANAECNLGHYDISDSLFQQLLTRYPEKLSTPINYSRCLMAQKKHGQAKSLLKREYDRYQQFELDETLASHYMSVCYNLGLATMRLHRCDEAKVYILEAKKYCKDNTTLKKLNLIAKEIRKCEGK